MAELKHEQRHSQPVSEVVTRCRELCIYGRYKDALAELDPYIADEILAVPERVDALRASARVFVFLGYPKAARECITKAQGLPLESLSVEKSLGLEVHNAYVTEVACGEETESNDLLDRAREWLVDVPVEHLFRPEKLDMVNYLARIALFRQYLYQRKIPDVKPEVSKRFKSIISKAVEAARFDVVWTLFEPYAGAIGPKATIKWLSSLLDETHNMPDPIRGLLNLAVASRLGVGKSLPECADRLSLANALLRECKHTFGEVEVRRYRLQYELVPSENVLREQIEVIAQYCSLDYPLGVLMSTMYPLQRAFDCGDFRTYVNLQHVFHNVCQIAGIVHERMLLEVQLLAAMNAATGRHGKVMELGLPLYEECCWRKYWAIAMLVAQVLSLAESQVENLHEGQRWARVAFALCKDHNLTSESTAAFNLAHILSVEVKLHKRDHIALAQEITSLLAPYVERDINANETKLACEKLSLIASTQVKLSRAYPQDNFASSNEVFATWDRIDVLAQNLEGTDRALVEGDCEEARVIQLMHEGRHRPDNVKEDEAIRRLDALIAKYQTHKLAVQEANKHLIKGMCHIQKWQKVPSIDSLINAESNIRLACEKFQAISSMQFLLRSRHQLCRLYVQAWDLRLLPLENCLHEFDALEIITDNIRRELSAKKGLQALLQKQHFTASPQVQDLYRWAAGVCSHAEDSANLWLWSQKRKARSLSDMLGLGIIMPKSIIMALNDDPAARLIFEAWKDAQARLATTPEIERGYVRQEIEDAESQLKTFASFANYVALRDGVVTGVHQAGNLQNPFGPFVSPRETYLVDWIFHRNDVFILLTLCGAETVQPQLNRLGIAVTQVEQWLSEHFSTDESRIGCLREDSLDDPDSPLRRLDALVAPLEELTKCNDLLIFSPTSSLFSVPLHALKVRGADAQRSVPLIARNPVVYTPSFTVLENCVEKSKRLYDKGHASFLSSFDHAAEAEVIAQHMCRLSQSLQGRHASGEEVTKVTFGDLTHKARLIHFHGHCLFSADNVLKQSLVLTPEPGPAASADENYALQKSATIEKFFSVSVSGTSEDLLGLESESPEGSSLQKSKTIELGRPSLPVPELADGLKGDALLLTSREDEADTKNQLTLEEIFRLPLAPALMVLIACSSSSQSISAGDEPMGLITGLLCAGVTSVVGASWPIPSRTGRAFSKSFYQAFARAETTSQDSQGSLEDSSGDHASFIDLALTLQSAVKAMMDENETSETYHWAAFSLWGSWGFRSDLLGGYERPSI